MRFALLVFVLSLIALPSGAARMVALVIGNGDYAEVAPLENPANDAAAMAGALGRLGFDVQFAQDASQDEMRRAVNAFSKALDGADVALFYYAGHGIQLTGRNYLIPTDTALETEADVALATIPLDVIIAQMDRGAKTRIVFLDACRNNPFEDRLAKQLGSTRSANVLGSGLAPIETVGGTFVGFATDPGAVAFDGDGAHSPFTAALLKHIETPGLEINTMMTRVRADVYNETERLQRPWSSSSLLEELYLVPKATVAPPGTLEDATAWESAAAAHSVESYRAYLAAFPDGLFAALAEDRIASLGAPPEDIVAALANPLPDAPVILEDRNLTLATPTPGDVPRKTAPQPQLAALLPETTPRTSACELCPRMVQLPGGETVMGSSEGTSAERPRISQTIPAFQISATEVTVGDIRTFLSETGHTIPRGCWIWTAEGKMRSRKSASWEAPGYETDDALPASCVNWDDALAYIAWLNEIDPEGGWRLPSEAEFEYAARAGSEAEYAFPGGAADICAHVNGADATSRFRWRNKACSDGAEPPTPAADFPPNAFGLSHMIGNLWEWTGDCWNGSHKGALADGQTRTSGTCSSRVLRGGSWDDPIENLRSAYRVGIPKNRRQANVGFRVVKSP